jgi:hypothetical protein
VSENKTYSEGIKLLFMLLFPAAGSQGSHKRNMNGDAKEDTRVYGAEHLTSKGIMSIQRPSLVYLTFALSCGELCSSCRFCFHHHKYQALWNTKWADKYENSLWFTLI